MADRIVDRDTTHSHRSASSTMSGADLREVLDTAEKTEFGYSIYMLLPEDKVVARTGNPIPATLYALLPGFISNFDTLPKSLREEYERIATENGYRLSELYVRVLIGTVERFEKIIQLSEKLLPKPMGRPPTERETNNYLAERALKIRSRNKIPWADVAFQLMQDLNQDSCDAALSDEGKAALSKLQTILETSNRQNIGTFIQKIVIRAPK